MALKNQIKIEDQEEIKNKRLIKCILYKRGEHGEKNFKKNISLYIDSSYI